MELLRLASASAKWDGMEHGFGQRSKANQHIVHTVSASRNKGDKRQGSRL